MNSKIVFLFDYNPFIVSSAASQRYSTIIKEIAKCGIQVYLLILGSNDRGLDFQEIENLTIKYYSKFKTDSLMKQRIWIYGLQYLTLGLMHKKVKIDLEKINGDFIWYSNSFTTLKFINNFKIVNYKHILEVTEFHNLNTEIVTDRSFIRRFFLKTEVNNFNIALCKFDIILFITNNLKDLYSKDIPKNIKTFLFPMIVDYERFNSMDPTAYFSLNRKVLKYMGSFSNEKDGINILIHAFSGLVKKYDNVFLELAGGNHADMPGQIKIIQSLRLEDKIKFVGMLDKTEIPGFLSGGTILVLPRPNSKQAEGGFPTKLGEYLASGIPVCCTSVGEIPLYMEDKETIFFANPSSSSSLQETLEFILDNPVLAVKVGLKGRIVAEQKFGATKQVNKLMEVLGITNKMNLKNDKK